MKAHIANDIELKTLIDHLIELFGISSPDELKGAVSACVFTDDTDKMSAFCEFVGDLTIDWIQKIFQYYEADRVEKKQDYTPLSLCKLCAELTKTEGDTVYDICAGSGALTIQKWAQNSQKTFICEELDTNVLPFLLFNMIVRNMSGYVINRDVLSQKLIKVYRLISRDKFSMIEEQETVPDFEADEIVCNPPYNIKWDSPLPMFADDRFIDMCIPPKSNANFAFVFTAIHKLKKSGKCAFILPNGILSSQPEQECRECLTNAGYVEKIIENPNRMFESTDIGTNIILFSRGNKEISLYDLRLKGTETKREQRGQFGGASHTNRTYAKIVNTLSDELIDSICNKPCSNIAEYSKVVSNEEIAANNYRWAPSHYIELLLETDNKHRPYADIVKNINDIIRLRNSCKLTINESLAKALGFDVELFKKANTNSQECRKSLSEMVKLDMLTDDYIAFSKDKNKIIFSSNDKDILSHLFAFFLNSWKQDIDLLNTLENTYLTELRDALLPDLMSGNVDLFGEENEKEGEE